MDMSQTRREPVVVAGRIEHCVDRLTHLRRELAEVEDELRQLMSISSEMWTAQGFPMTWAEFESSGIRFTTRPDAAEEAVANPPENSDQIPKGTGQEG
ncbi:Uncharacterised protein [Mycobacteroides abscessus subsp. abscessus]|nr:Uncharacterised protein [Mycobacteroides abscessus subsp. abscessus]SIC80537.1 Uncharacterised protein [Mycobacteroides abscessus subsp. abscessus]SKP26025.1 Uncharacterised protein [Mycobacteroides abscessus subsp. abscessus]